MWPSRCEIKFLVSIYHAAWRCRIGAKLNCICSKDMLGIYFTAPVSASWAGQCGVRGMLLVRHRTHLGTGFFSHAASCFAGTHEKPRARSCSKPLEREFLTPAPSPLTAKRSRLDLSGSLHLMRGPASGRRPVGLSRWGRCISHILQVTSLYYHS